VIQGLRSRVTLLCLVVGLVTMGVVGAHLVPKLETEALGQLRGQLVNQAWLLAEASRPCVVEGEMEALEEIAWQVAKRDDTAVAIFDGAGEVLVDSSGTVSEGRRNMPPEIVEALAGKVGSDVRYEERGQSEMLYVAVPLADGEIVGAVRIGYPPGSVKTIGSHVILALAGGLVGIVALGWLFSGLLGRMVSGPVGKLVHMAGRMGKGELHEPVRVGAWKEFASLGTALNAAVEEIREREAQIRSERDRFLTTIETMADGVIVVDGARTVTVVNQAAVRLLRSSRERMVGHSFIGAVHDHEMDAILRESLRQGTEQSGMVEVEPGKLYIGVIATPVRDGEGGVVVLNDLTEVHRLGTMRRDLVANISHELRTPLASLKMLTESLLEGALDDRGVAENFVQKINTETERLAQMVNELRDLSVIESMDTELQMEAVDVGATAMQAARRLQAQADRAGLELEVDIPAALPHVMGDRERLEQALVNLLHNAVKFTPRGGRVSLSAAVQGSEVVVSVADTGVGIAEEDLPRVFERFYKADKARSGGGTGLGLAIVKHVVQAHHGRVWVESVEGKGATFRFSLPVSKVQ
jgi:two-component system phosphate regulon sensor histidine kinase PhoR